VVFDLNPEKILSGSFVHVYIIIYILYIYTYIYTYIYILYMAVSRNPIGLRRSHAIGPEHHVIAEGYKFVM